jgi:hypothetical protein
MVNKEKIKLLNLLEEIGDVVFLDSTEKAFIHYFSNLDINGVSSLMSENHKYENYYKSEFLEFLNTCFLDLKNRNINKLKVYKGKCSRCFKNQGSLTFIDKKSGDFIDFFILVKDNKVININFCYGLKNYSKIIKKNRLEVIPFSNLPF